MCVELPLVVLYAQNNCVELDIDITIIYAYILYV